MIKKINERAAILHCLISILEEDKFCDRVVQEYLVMVELSGVEKNFIMRETYGVTERKLELDYRIQCYSNTKINKMDKGIRNILRMGMYELTYMDQIPEGATCNEMVELASTIKGGRFKGFVNGILRSAIREKDKFVMSKDLSIQYSMPSWIVEHLSESYGRKTTKKILTTFLDKKKLTLNIDTNRISVDDYIKECRKQGITARTGEYCKEAVIVEGDVIISQLPGFGEGICYMQDESSMLPVMCSGIDKGNFVMDLCGAPGGKTVQAARKMAGTGRVSTRDVSKRKVDKIYENIKRLQLTNVETKVWDARVTDNDCMEKADVVLADVPCSGMGIIGRKPDIKYHISKESLDELVTLQREILKQAVQYVKHGGVLIYSTCTMNPKENVDNAKWIADEFAFSLESLDEFLPECLQNSQSAQGMLQILPGVHKSDGFFVARLRKEK